MENKNATLENQRSVNDIEPSNANKKRPPFKLELCLEELIKRGDAGMFELEALSAYGETCLHTTISALFNKHGLNFSRTPESHHHKRGGETRFTRYSLSGGESFTKAKALLKHYQVKRGVITL
ncbi:hypothetical protein RT723_09795 [Psychrosphaera aquimarina]|uniref:Transcriptional regulator n=1 Tax=Psychrosphaera aquimarina TaxID=2044854 RepID=A0ABU3R0T1_9GAMM|nr:hypothetical protein [Psychrosphaera aquimarina]MDU0113281.1 hypothetical protein [Psychrosphaera aquimarina]